MLFYLLVMFVRYLSLILTFLLVQMSQGPGQVLNIVVVFIQRHRTSMMKSHTGRQCGRPLVLVPGPTLSKTVFFVILRNEGDMSPFFLSYFILVLFKLRATISSF
jgi:hypothetical protein